MIPCSVHVLTRNCADNLATALVSVMDFDEIIVCDGGSTDGTLTVAARFGAKVIAQDPAHLDDAGRLVDYGGAREQMLAATTQPWVLYLDSDELLHPDAPLAILEAIDGAIPATAAGFRLLGRHLVRGREVTAASFYPYRVLRLFRTDAVTGYTPGINENPVFVDGATITDLDAVILVPLPPLCQAARKWWRYARIDGQRARTLPPAERSRRQAHLRSQVRWLARGLVASRREPGPRMPLRHEVGRIGFALASWAAVRMNSAT